jgi:release factor glutamine methyltransferase
VSEAEWQQLAVEIKEHEPRTALVAGPRGSETIARLIPQAGQRLRSGGWLLLEVSPMIETATHQLLADDARFESVHTVKDLAGLPRVVKAKRR